MSPKPTRPTLASQTGDYHGLWCRLQTHVHYHIPISDGVWFPDDNCWALGYSILKSLVARRCLEPETANLLESWPALGILGLYRRPDQPARRPARSKRRTSARRLTQEGKTRVLHENGTDLAIGTVEESAR